MYPPDVWQSLWRTIIFPDGVNWIVPGNTGDEIIDFKPTWSFSLKLYPILLLTPIVNFLLNNISKESFFSIQNSGPLETCKTLSVLNTDLQSKLKFDLLLLIILISSPSWRKYDEVIPLNDDLLPRIDFISIPPEIAR